MKKPFKVSAIVLNYNRVDALLECINSLLKQEYPLTEIIVVDNNSSDESGSAIKDNFPTVKLIENDRNYGAIEGKNIGLRAALKNDPDFIFLLDNDLVADPKCVSQMVNLGISEKNIGMVGAKIYDYDHKDVILSCGSKIDFTQNIIRQYGRGEKDVGQYDKVMDVDHLGAGHTLIKKQVFDLVGILDSKFIGYGYEDVDFSVRAKKAGFRIVCCPSAIVWHKPHSGIGNYSFNKKYLEAKNSIYFMKKHGTFETWIKYLFFAFFGIAYAFLLEVPKGNWRGVWGKARGLWDGFWGSDQLAWKILERSENS